MFRRAEGRHRSTDSVDALISIIRLPIAVVATVFFFLFHVVVFVLESLVALVAFPFAVVLMSRNELKQSWFATYPNGWHGLDNDSFSIVGFLSGLSRIWEWVARK